LCASALKRGVKMHLESETRTLESEISKRLQAHHLLEIAELVVRVRGGVAFIKGTVPNLKQKKLAGEITGQVNGIRDVINMLMITPLPITDDESLGKRITQALARNPNVDESKISIEVVNGIVFLDGFTNTAVEKRLVEQEVWATAGVKDIVNKIEVISARPKSDVEVIGEILQSFSQCLGLDLSKMSVEIKGGVAYLRGVVPTDYLKDAAEELATWVPSIASVVNELKVLETPALRRHTPIGPGRSPAKYLSKNVKMGGSRALSRENDVLG